MLRNPRVDLVNHNCESTVVSHDFCIYRSVYLDFLKSELAGLDPIMTNVIGRLISSCVNKLGATAVSITSDMTGAKQISDRIAMLHEGRIIWAGRKSAAESSGNPYVDQLIHSRAQGPIQMRVTRE